MWKLPDQVTKYEFRQWLDSIDTYLAAAQPFEYPEVVLDKVRRHESEVNQLSWAGIVAAANTDVPRNKKDRRVDCKRQVWRFHGWRRPMEA